MTQSPLAERPQQDQEVRVRGSAPNFLHRGQFAYLGKGLVSRRLTEPAIDVSELPVDLIVLSHLHGDHFDRVAKAGLDRSVPILTTVQAANRLNRWGFRALPLNLAGRDRPTFRVDVASDCPAGKARAGRTPGA